MPTVLRRIGWGLVILGATAMFLQAAGSIVIFTIDRASYIDFLIESFAERPVAFYLHVLTGMAGIALGPLQFFLRRLSPPGRRKYLPLHRTLGRVYVVAAVLTGLSGLYLAPFAFGGLVAASGFGILALLLLATTLVAYVHIRRRNERAHREWMTRSYAVMFAVVTFRLIVNGVAAFGVEFEQAYAVSAWLCWMLNLAIAEALIILVLRRRPEPPPRLAAAASE